MQSEKLIQSDVGSPFHPIFSQNLTSTRSFGPFPRPDLQPIHGCVRLSGVLAFVNTDHCLFEHNCKDLDIRQHKVCCIPCAQLNQPNQEIVGLIRIVSMAALANPSRHSAQLSALYHLLALVRVSNFPGSSLPV